MLLENYVFLFMLTDLISIWVGGLWPRFFMARFAGYSPEILNAQAAVVGGACCLYILLSQALNVYRADDILDRGALKRPATALFATFGLLVVIGAATKTSGDNSRIWFFSWIAINLVLLLGMRLLLLALAHKKQAEGGFVYRALSIGVFAEPLSRSDIADITHGQAVVVDEIRLNRMEEMQTLGDTIAAKDVDLVYHVTPWVDAPMLLEKLRSLKETAAELYVLPKDARVRDCQLGSGTLGGGVSLRAAARPIAGWNLWGKRCLDLVISTTSLIFFAPLLVLVALAIKLESPGPVLFRQQRVGANGRLFEVMKFRSMKIESADPLASRQTSRGDARVTRVGRIIRRLSIDEFPQFINVLRGEMSVVGPRPHAPGTTTNGAQLAEICDQYVARHRVKPGLTGLAQINGFRGELDTVDKVKRRVACDLDYIEHWSIWLDVKIMLRTALLLLYDPAAY